MARARTCDDCFFRARALCALEGNEPCPTFREIKAGRMVAPRQATLVETTVAAEAPNLGLVFARS